jgi:glycosyltransferase involved in cell wall biosynthesis
LAVADPRVAALRLAQNVGQNRAVLIGLAYAQGDVVVVMDADLQDPPEAIPTLLPFLTDDVAAVFAGRRGQYEGRGRLLSSWLFKHMLYVLSAGRVPTDAGLFVAMRQTMRSRLLAFDVPQPYVVGLMGRTGLKLRSVPVMRHANNERESGYTTRKRIALACNAVRQLLPIKHVTLTSNHGQPPVLIREYVGARFQALA